MVSLRTLLAGAAAISAASALGTRSPDPGAALQPRSIDKHIKLKIMPLGASIVWGVDSTDHNGFREHLRDLVEANHGNKVTYVGTRFHGNMTNNACEAYPGDTIGEVMDRSMSSGAFDYLPNVLLIHVGTNDCTPDLDIGPSTAAAKFGDLLASIKSKVPDALVLASTLIKNLDRGVDERIVKFNALLPAVVKNATDGGQKVTLVDMHDAVPKSDINTTDYTHPNDAGYAIMARVWYEGLVNSSSLITKPSAHGKAAPKTPSKASKAMLQSAPWILVPLAIWMLIT
ncbi:hypothetical protein LTR08_006778 [Meristemomyces frigidus]|nr:hypothetical protein LTR08_006778 [Meristemomyces frigidus]